MPERGSGGPPLLRLVDLKMHFDVSPPLLTRVLEGRGREVLKAVDGIGFEIPRGTNFSIVGESGCGKSTVARCIVGLYQPTAGRIDLDGTDVGSLRGRRASLPFRRRVQMVFQDPYSSLNPRWRAERIISEPIRTHEPATTRRDRRRRVVDLLEQVGLSAEDRLKYPHEFSGGQRQRISIARALASRPDFIVCDEPTSALDVSVQAQILNLMSELQSDLGLTYLFISHDLAVVAHVSDRIAVMYLGRFVEWGDALTILTAPRHPYTMMMLDTVPRINEPPRKREPPRGEVPNPLRPPAGCTFHPRCPYARDECRSVVPVPMMADGRMVACHGVAHNWLRHDDLDAEVQIRAMGARR